MPIYEFATDDGEIIEQIFSVKDCPDEIFSTHGRSARKIVSKIAHTPQKWGDSHEKPYFSRALGRMVQGKQHADKLARARGFIPATELGSESESNRILDSLIDAQGNTEKSERADYDAYQNIVTTEGPAKAEEWFVHKTLHTLE